MTTTQNNEGTVIHIMLSFVDFALKLSMFVNVSIDNTMQKLEEIINRKVEKLCTMHVSVVHATTELQFKLQLG